MAKLIMPPMPFIDLPDGRRLYLKEWSPTVAANAAFTARLEVIIGWQDGKEPEELRA